jgi:hypothetical protein
LVTSLGFLFLVEFNWSSSGCDLLITSDLAVREDRNREWATIYIRI